jgi:hypothetical protein
MKKHGGKRKGSGRKKGSVKEPTKVIRVPISKVEEINNILKNK